jgi:hypothetical protein
MKSVTRLWALLLLAPVSAFAGPLLDYIRNYDLNDYAAIQKRSTPISPVFATRL